MAPASSPPGVRPRGRIRTGEPRDGETGTGSNSPSCSASTSSRTWLMRASAGRTGIFPRWPPDRLAYRENTAIPGPMAAWGRSTGAMRPVAGPSAPWELGVKGARNPRRSVNRPRPVRRSARTMDEASVFSREHSVTQFGTHRPSRGYSQPAGAFPRAWFPIQWRPIAPLHSLGLLEGVEQGDREILGGAFRTYGGRLEPLSKNSWALPYLRAGTGLLRAPDDFGARTWQTEPGRSGGGTAAATHRRSPTSPNTRYCRSKEGPSLDESRPACRP